MHPCQCLSVGSEQGRGLPILLLHPFHLHTSISTPLALLHFDHFDQTLSTYNAEQVSATITNDGFTLQRQRDFSVLPLLHRSMTGYDYNKGKDSDIFLLQWGLWED